MKRTLFILGCIIAFLSSCSNEDLDNNVTSRSTQKSEKIRWYGVKSVDNPQSRGVADGSKRWNQNAGIYIKFINTPSDPKIIDQIKIVAKDWEKYAGIKFHYVDQDKKADVRIAFDWEGNDWLTWSYTGNEAKFVRNQDEPTAVFVGIQYLSKDEFNGDVLRLFGQILGLEYEQRHQEWNEKGYWTSPEQLQAYWKTLFQDMHMDWSEIRQYVLDPLTSQNTIQLLETKELDELSVMAWPYYSAAETSNLIANYELSAGDKSFISRLYPKSQDSLLTIQEVWVDAGYFTWTDYTKTSVVITDLGRQQEFLPDVSDGEQLKSAYNMFRGAKIKQMPVFNSENITRFDNMFYECKSLLSIDLLNTSSGTSFNYMFYDCASLKTIPLLDTSKGINFGSMFNYCQSLTSVPLLNTSKGTNFSSMFYASNLTSIPPFNTSNGTNFSSMFSDCKYLEYVPFLNTSKGVSFNLMFGGCAHLTSVPPLDTWKGVDFRYMFAGCERLKSIPLLDTSKGTNFTKMFSECESLTSLPLLDTSKGVNFSSMFYSCTLLTTIPLLDTSNGTNFSSMFSACKYLESIPLLNTSKGVNFNQMFNYTAITSVPALDTSSGVDFRSMFYGCQLLEFVPALNTSNGTNFNSMFLACSSLKSKPQLDLSNSVNSTNMFYGTPFD